MSYLNMKYLFLLLTPFIVWLIISYEGGEILSQDIIKNTKNTDTYQNIPSWLHLSSDAHIQLSEQAEQHNQINTAKTEALLALNQNISSGRAASNLLTILDKEKKTAQADAIAQIASKLWPVHTYTHSRLAYYWSLKGRLDKLIPEWNIILSRNPSIRPTIFSTLKVFLTDPKLRSFLNPYIESPPNWWNDFFKYLTTQPIDLNIIKKIHEQRLRSKTPLNKSEWNSYINRLLKEKHWLEAYNVWKKSLTPNQYKYIKLIYDGGFEDEISNSGFDWNIRPERSVKIYPDVTYGMKNTKALKISISKDKRIAFQHAWQQLLLPPDTYQLQMRYRLDNFKTSKGLRWRVYCFDPELILLGESIALKGATPWNSLEFNFEVPNSNCPTQLLRLEADSKYEHEHTFDGTLWFDELMIKPVKKEISR